MRSTNSEKPVKADTDKVMLDLLPVEPLEQVGQVFTFGAKKYAAWNYMRGEGISASRLYAACLRHLFAWFKGEDLDKESNLPHLAHAVCCIMMIMQVIRYRDADDRPEF